MSNSCKFKDGYLDIHIEGEKTLDFKFDIDDVFYLILKFLVHKSKFTEVAYKDVMFTFYNNKTEISYFKKPDIDIIKNEEGKISFKDNFYHALIDAVHYIVQNKIEDKYFKIHHFSTFYDEYHNLNYIIIYYDSYFDKYQLYFISNYNNRYDIRTVSTKDKILILNYTFTDNKAFDFSYMYIIETDDLELFAVHNSNNPEIILNNYRENIIFNNLEIIICDPEYGFKNIIKKTIKVN